ncbi:MAG: NERD domain-containing protein [Gammaproteobacteria bacterium]|nr:NERD domain-containing protein [Gammaproteobacteria bacterium]
MFDSLYAMLIALTLSFFPVAVAIGIISFIKKQQRKNRVSPLTANLLRPYGYTLQESIHDLKLELFGQITEILMIGLMLPLLLLIQAYFFNIKLSLTAWIITGTIGFITFVFKIRNILKLVKSLEQNRLGYSCEMAVGQELENLIRPVNHPYRLYHDIPFENYNIDHLVVGPNGVFVVETKGRSKHIIEGSKQFKVVVENDSLIFPTHTEKEPIEQVRRNVLSVRKWLQSATGMDIPVAGILVLPGWFVELKQRAIDPYILNASALPKVFPKLFAGALELGQINAIAYQVEQRVRDIKRD